MSGCPAIDVLEEALVGRAPDAEVLRHVESCSACQKRAQRIRDDQALSGLLKRVDAGRLAAALASGKISAAVKEAPPPDLVAGYEILAEISRGGQGVVYRAVQKSTRSKVAIKILREGPFAGARERTRFEQEAQILGQLNHPNIVTIIDSGAAGGHFYLVTKYISGRSLNEWILDFGAGILDSKRDGGPDSGRSQSKTSPSHSKVQIPRSKIEPALRLFVKICDAVTAAHLRGVIHRDLKPGNVRIDNEGEPHVLDFGLAKLVGGEVTDESHPQLMTRTGQFMGTPAYASPEQAEGLPDQIDLRTDVYSLGVILYQILTGRFPYETAGSLRDVLDNILHTEPLKPSAVRGASGKPLRHIDGEIETIILKCLAKERERRYQSAGELARDLRHYLASEPLDAKRDSVGYVLRKQLRRYWIPAAVVAAFVLTLAGATVALSVMYRNQSHARQRAEAEAAKQRTVNQFVQSMLAKADRGKQGGNPNVTVREALETAEQVFEAGQVNFDPEVEAAVRHTMGLTYHALGLYDRAEQMLRVGLTLQRGRLGNEHPDTAESLNDLGTLLRIRGDFTAAETLLREALQLRRKLRGPEHPDTAESLNSLGQTLSERGNLAEAEPFLREALAIYHKQLGNLNPKTAASKTAQLMNNLGMLSYRKGDLPGAESMFREAVEMNRQWLGNERSETAGALSNLAAVLLAKGNLAEAELLFREVVELQRKLLGNEDAALATALDNLGGLLNAKGDYAGAEPLAREALEIRRKKLGAEHPDVADGLDNLASLLLNKGDLAGAEPLFREALALHRKQWGNEHPDVAWSLDKLGQVMHGKGELKNAEEFYREALDLRRKLLGRGHPDVAASLNNLAGLLRDRSDPAGAEPLLREALAIRREKLPADHPHLTKTLVLLGLVLLEEEKAVEAEPLLREVLAIRLRKLPAEDRQVGEVQSLLGACLVAQKKFAEAEPLLREGSEIVSRAPQAPLVQKRECLKRLVRLYEIWDKPEQAAACREQLNTLRVSDIPAPP